MSHVAVRLQIISMLALYYTMRAVIIKEILIVLSILLIVLWSCSYFCCSDMSESINNRGDHTFVFSEEIFPSAGKGAYKYMLFTENRVPVHFDLFLSELADVHSSMRAVLYETLLKRYDARVSHNKIAFFWECPGINIETMSSKQFEFVLIPTTAFNNVEADCTAFSEHIARNCALGNVEMVFKSLGKDATLISPCPVLKSGCTYTHLYKFIQHSERKAAEKFLGTIGIQFLSILNEKVLSNDKSGVWLSTSGLGIPWLHVRLDSRPKYYQYKGYKENSKNR